MAATRRFIEGRLRLQVNEEKSAVAVPDHRHFLGFSLRRHRDGQVEVHLSKKSRQRLDTRIRELTPATWGQSLKACFKEVNQYLAGWSAYYQLCTPEGASVFARYDAHIRRRIRRIIIHQKKRPRYLYRHLLTRGVDSKAAAGAAYSRRGAWHRSNRPGMTRAYPNIWFVGKLKSLKGEWRRFHPPKQASDQAWLFDPEILTQGAGCVAHKSGSVRGAVG